MTVGPKRFRCCIYLNLGYPVSPISFPVLSLSLSRTPFTTLLHFITEAHKRVNQLILFLLLNFLGRIRRLRRLPVGRSIDYTQRTGYNWLEAC